MLLASNFFIYLNYCSDFDPVQSETTQLPLVLLDYDSLLTGWGVEWGVCFQALHS